MRFLLTSVFYGFIAIGLGSCSGGLFSSKAPVQLQEAWATDNTLRTPEAALHDPVRNTIYVSNINGTAGLKKDGDGFISRLSNDGKIEELYWVTGLNDPKGMALHNNVLYVSDVDEIIAIATQSGAILGRYKADDAKFLNDVAVDEAGNVYVTDSEQKRIYMLRNGRVTTWLEKMPAERPNGIFVDGTRMVVAFNGEVRFLDLETKRWTSWNEGIKAGDGIAKVDDGFLISSWHGEVYFVNNEGRSWLLLDTKDKKINAADITYSDRTGLLLVPTFNDNRVVAYRLNR
ncbi:gluconolaconase [uncultured Pontibacter sp.]|uniref:SMP-30/gluconolactonase/LRE family protein n=1 Tax=uncultured Pontibacter sp. TaxID=453356 RepID=UPI002633BAF8|nr:gluconolaconase [uncultured Pontibacter sp.]